MKARHIKIDKKRSVTVAFSDKGESCLEFTSPLHKDDIIDGKIIPRAFGWRNKGKVHTVVQLSKEATEALFILLRDHFMTDEK